VNEPEKTRKASAVLALILMTSMMLALVMLAQPVVATASDTHFLVAADAACTATTIDTDADCWSHTSGGAGGAGVPGSGNAVVVDTNSLPGPLMAQWSGTMTVASWTTSGTDNFEIITLAGGTLNILGDWVQTCVNTCFDTASDSIITVGGDVTFTGCGTQVAGLRVDFRFTGSQGPQLFSTTCVAPNTSTFSIFTIEAAADVTLTQDIAVRNEMNLGGILRGAFTIWMLNEEANPAPVLISGDTGTPRPSMTLGSFSFDLTFDVPASGWDTLTLTGCNAVCDGSENEVLTMVPTGDVLVDSLQIAVPNSKFTDCGSVLLDASGFDVRADTIEVGTADPDSFCYGAGFNFRGDMMADSICADTSYTENYPSNSDPEPTTPCPAVIVPPTGGGSDSQQPSNVFFQPLVPGGPSLATLMVWIAVVAFVVAAIFWVGHIPAWRFFFWVGVIAAVLAFFMIYG
jgi:hypothetical protein